MPTFIKKKVYDDNDNGKVDSAMCSECMRECVE